MVPQTTFLIVLACDARGQRHHINIAPPQKWSISDLKNDIATRIRADSTALTLYKVLDPSRSFNDYALQKSPPSEVIDTLGAIQMTESSNTLIRETGLLLQPVAEKNPIPPIELPIALVAMADEMMAPVASTPVNDQVAEVSATSQNHAVVSATGAATITAAHLINDGLPDYDQVIANDFSSSVETIRTTEQQVEESNTLRVEGIEPAGDQTTTPVPIVRQIEEEAKPEEEAKSVKSFFLENHDATPSAYRISARWKKRFLIGALLLLVVVILTVTLIVTLVVKPRSQQQNIDTTPRPTSPTDAGNNPGAPSSSRSPSSPSSPTTSTTPSRLPIPSIPPSAQFWALSDLVDRTAPNPCDLGCNSINMKSIMTGTCNPPGCNPASPNYACYAKTIFGASNPQCIMGVPNSTGGLVRETADTFQCVCLHPNIELSNIVVHGGADDETCDATCGRVFGGGMKSLRNLGSEGCISEGTAGNGEKLGNLVAGACLVNAEGVVRAQRTYKCVCVL